LPLLVVAPSEEAEGAEEGGEVDAISEQ
jgi:hypothetical protein